MNQSITFFTKDKIMGDLLARYLTKKSDLELTFVDSFDIPEAKIPPAVIAVDIDHHGDPIEFLKELRNEHPHSRLLVLTSHVSDYIIHHLTKMRNLSIAHKFDGVGYLLEAITMCLENRAYSSPSIRALGKSFRSKAHPYRHLTSQNELVLRKLVSGQTKPKIAEDLGLGIETIISHKKGAMRQLDAHSEVELVLAAVKLGFPFNLDS